MKKIDDELLLIFGDPAWIDDLVTYSNGDNTKFAVIIAETEQNILLDLFQYLTYSVLEGEYVLNQEDFNNKVIEISTKIGTLQTQQISDDPNFELSFIFEKEKFLFTLKKSLQLYKRNSDSFHRLIKNPHKNIVFDIDNIFRERETKDYFSNSDKKLEIDLLSFFYTTLFISLDCFELNNNSNGLENLIKHSIKLEDMKGDFQFDEISFYHDILDLLKEINCFQIRKLLIRKYQDDESYKVRYVFDGNEFGFTLEEHPLNKNIFNKWDTYSTNHFLSENNSGRQNWLTTRAEQIIYEADGTPSTFFELHSLIKYYKDIAPNIANLESQNQFLDNFIPNNIFDLHAKKVTNNYLNNNIISLQLENEFQELRDSEKINSRIKDYVNKIRSLQSSSSINNFFPYFKLCEILQKIIEYNISIENFENENYLSRLDIAEKALTQFEELFSKYKSALKWSKRHLFNAFQSCYDECLIPYEVNDESINVFIASSFSIPIDYKKYENNIIELESFTSTVQNEIKSLKNVALLSDSLIQKEFSIQNEIKENLKKNIEILGIFSAIIALLFQSAYTSQSEESFESKLFTFVLMFLALFSFLFMLRIFISKGEKNKKETSILNILLICFIAILLILTLILFRI